MRVHLKAVNADSFRKTCVRTATFFPKQNKEYSRMRREVFTSTDVARILRCSNATVYRLIEEGALSAYRIPDSTHRRVTRSALAKFLKDQNLLLERLTIRDDGVLVISTQQEVQRSIRDALTESFVVTAASEPFTCGYALRRRPETIRVVIIDTRQTENRYLAEKIRSTRSCALVALCNQAVPKNELDAFDAVLALPFDPTLFHERICALAKTRR